MPDYFFDFAESKVEAGVVWFVFIRKAFAHFDYYLAAWDDAKKFYYELTNELCSTLYRSRPAMRNEELDRIISSLSEWGCEVFLEVAAACKRHDITLLLIERMHELNPPEEDRFAL